MQSLSAAAAAKPYDRLSAIFGYGGPPGAGKADPLSQLSAQTTSSADAATGSQATAASSDTGTAAPLTASDLAMPFQQLQSTLQALLIQVQSLTGATPPHAALVASQSGAQASADGKATPSVGELRNDVNSLMADLASALRASRQAPAGADPATAPPDGGAAQQSLTLQANPGVAQTMMQAAGSYAAAARAVDPLVGSAPAVTA